jgi:hypothetical protein
VIFVVITRIIEAQQRNSVPCVCHTNEIWKGAHAVQVPEHESGQHTAQRSVERDECPRQMPVPVLFPNARTSRAGSQLTSTIRRVQRVSFHAPGTVFIHASSVDLAWTVTSERRTKREVLYTDDQ